MAITLQPLQDHSVRWRWATALGFAGTALVVLLGLRSPTAFSIALLLAVLAVALAGGRVWGIFRDQPVFWLALLLFVAVFLRGWMDIATVEAHGREIDPRSVWHHARYGPLLPLVFGLWLAAYWHYRHYVLLLLAFAAFIYYFHRWDSVMARWPGPDGPPTNRAFDEGGMVSMVMVFVAFGVVASAWTPGIRTRPVVRSIFVATGVVLAAISLTVLVVSLARASWLGLLVGLVVLGLLGTGVGWQYASLRERRMIVAGLVGLVAVVSVTVLLSWELVAGRLARDTETIRALLTGQTGQDEVPGGSFGTRYRMFRQGLIDIGNNPLLGVGPASIRDMAQEIWGRSGPGTGDYHSTWINLMVTMGVPWALLWIGVHLWVAWRVTRDVILRQRDWIVGMTLIGAFVAQFVQLTFTVRIWGGFAGTTIYLLMVLLLMGAMLQSDRRASARISGTDGRIG